MQFAAVQKYPRYRVKTAVDVVDADAQMKRLPLENISLGGMFIHTLSAATPGSTLRIRLHDQAASATLGLTARVVHVIDEAHSPLKRHPPGMGVQFEQVTPQTQVLLRVFVETLAKEAAERAAAPVGVRFIDPQTVQVALGRALLAELWNQSLRYGGLFAEGSSPPLGSRVDVVIGPLRLQADVVHVQPGHGAGLQITNLDGPRRSALERFLEGSTPEIVAETPQASGPPLGKVLAIVRQLFQPIEEGDAFAAIGLPSTASEDEIKKRLQALLRLFAQPRPDATPPQAARIAAAARALARLEPGLLSRGAALRREGELAAPPPVQPERDELRRCMSEASAAELRGDRVEARRMLSKALELAPNDETIRKRLGSLQENVDLQRAVELLKSAEVFAKGLGMAADAIRSAEEAMKLSPRREIKLRAAGVFARAGDCDQALFVIEQVLMSDPRDPLALKAGLHLYEKTERWPQAARAAQLLSQMNPDDDEMKKRVKKLEKMRK